MIKNRRQVKMLLYKGTMFYHQQAAELGIFNHVLLVLASRIEERYMESYPMFKESQRPNMRHEYSYMKVQKGYCEKL